MALAARAGLVGVAAVVSIGLTLPFFLPYLEVQDQGFARTLDDARMYSRQWRRLAGLVGVGASLVAAAPSRASTRCCSRGVLALAAGRGRRGDRVAAVGSADAPAGGWRATIAGFYVLLAVLAFWASFGPDAGLYRLLFETIPIFALLRAPARIGLLVTLSLESCSRRRRWPRCCAHAAAASVAAACWCWPRPRS